MVETSKAAICQLLAGRPGSNQQPRCCAKLAQEGDARKALAMAGRRLDITDKSCTGAG